ncbi:MAG: peptidyl-tRNA hydrolase [Candidatus Acididesulfobacter diazotrophicus]|jgi:PTH1 family peptidyl-tRNA hydrolase|uniref:Peptidyl-tRNA hydrolase n=1 Tax=Candidatus Acididesulfobacter diazotrophicus TaxID=2597226 RepID=A0A519BJM7_9DELT|nr:MAG: peptidyl-tRNA hydrolase [Candidatus Acididesulfobacter diazotrophicus]
MSSDIFIFGLGNPGIEYKFTRHNFGFIAVDSFAETNSFPDFINKKNYAISSKSFLGLTDKRIIYLIKPLTFMNLSGIAVKEVLKKNNIFYKKPDIQINKSDNKNNKNELIDIDNGPLIIVIHDDLDLNYGRIKIKYGGSGGSHNGIISIINSLQSKEFLRLKLGTNSELRNKFRTGADYVLSRFSKDEIKQMPEILRMLNDIIISFINDGLTKTMNKFNSILKG